MKRSWLYVLAAVALVAAGVGAYALGVLARPAPEYYGTVLNDPPKVNEITLAHVSDGDISLTDYQGQYLLMFFGFTRCPDVCPFTLSRLAKLYGDLGEPDDVQVVMVTVDPETDTPELVQRYVAGFHEAFVGLSGSPAQIAAAAKAFFIGFQQLPDSLFSHTDVVALLDREGRMQLIYGQDRIPRIADDLAAVRARGRF